MSPTPTPNRVRADSAIDGIETVPKTLVTAHNLRAAVSLFASDTGIQAFTELLNLFSQREKDMTARDKTIRDLNTKISAQKHSDDAFSAKQLSMYQKEYDGWKKKETVLDRKLEELKVMSDKKDKEVMGLRRQLEAEKAKNTDLEEECTQNTKRLKEMNQDILQLDDKLQKFTANAHTLQQDLNESNDQTALLEKSLAEQKKQCQLLETEAKKSKDRVKDFVKFSVKIKELDPTM
jgi:chromosome segregation ATPase